MKIKTKVLPYAQVMSLPRPAHKLPQKPGFLLRSLVRLASIPDLRATQFRFEKRDLERLGPGPYLILMNHSSFLDLEIVSRIFYPKPYCIVCTSDGFVGKERLMRNLGCIPTNKFVSDVRIFSDLEHALHKLKVSVLLYPEASYSFDGTATPLPRKLGVLLKRLDVPVVSIHTQGAFARDPLYNCLQKRKVQASATVTGLLSRDEIHEKSVSELDAILDEAFTFDNFAWQKAQGVRIEEPFRADGLERILYRCAHCGTEGQMEGKGVELRCHACGKRYKLTSLGELEALDGETEFPHIPDYYAWERECVRSELEPGSYRLDTEVSIGMLVDFKAIYLVGDGRLVHDETGFTLTGCNGKLCFSRPARLNYSLYADYYWYELGDIICIGDQETQYYCFPKGNVSVAKARLATEELYKLLRARRKAVKTEEQV